MRPIVLKDRTVYIGPDEELETRMFPEHDNSIANISTAYYSKLCVMFPNVITGIQYGCQYLVYSRNSVHEHAPYGSFCVAEKKDMDWFDFIAKLRVLHSVKKKALVGYQKADGSLGFLVASRWDPCRTRESSSIAS